MSIVRDLIKQLPKGRILTEPREFAIDELTIVNGISNPPSIEPLFKELKCSGESSRLKVLKFDCNWVEKRIEFDFQEIIQLLSKYGPFENLERLAILGQDYLDPAHIDDIHVLEQLTPHLQCLDMDIAYGVGFGKPFALKNLQGAQLYDVNLQELNNFSRCSFPALEKLHVCFSIDSAEKVGNLTESLKRFFGPDFAPKLESLNLSVFYGEKEPNSIFIKQLLTTLPEIGRRKHFQSLQIPGIFSEEQKVELEDEMSRFEKLEYFSVGGGI